MSQPRMSVSNVGESGHWLALIEDFKVGRSGTAVFGSADWNSGRSARRASKTASRPNPGRSIGRETVLKPAVPTYGVLRQVSPKPDFRSFPDCHLSATGQAC